ncbi:TPA_exp: putative secreted protein [Trichophyton benhamiae CBS 112371]|uniref:Uncharacterized secreted protein ARB_05566 n=1 Tax=Arthroderma benhamiae (strain ATCC MYA-4681 / CBS 112371) TaxID=663331 RepID=A5566_ARTBC|nr:uncharacterized protein ARB_05566 [Trichophyton benhamiae CBS 112371]D4AMW3.1 RecName: Full=Uncharacterized secreted protein ARB_05566; Flags: Precursor [Trichophyton benhamiae CBS 112371]EFE35524.1 hypothetical protein ARB_05566 [Trichophyton benhamiae CBS 112371]DAA78371.1 TPA_exp: putative secreted protein [Trichophyton benhamiae CBS 112371]
MKVFAYIALATVVAGANIRNHFGDNCKGGYLDYPNIAQRICASALHDKIKGAVTVAFSQLPQHSYMNGYQNTRDGGICGSRQKQQNVGNTDHKCLPKLAGGAEYAGSSWTAPGFKAASEKDMECTSEMAPHALVLNDGHKYALGGMEKDMINTLYSMAIEGKGFQELPTEFGAFEIEKEGAQQRAQEIKA